MSVLGIITARGGSKGVPRKNIRDLGGKPLIAWTIEAAKAARHIDRLILSSDDPEIISVAKKWGCEVPFVREPELASDTATSLDVVLDAVARVPGFDWVVLLQPTSPLRTGADIDAAILKCLEASAPACASVCEAQESPYWMFHLNGDGVLVPLLGSLCATRRQDLPPVYSLNGAIYVANIVWLKSSKAFITAETAAYPMPVGRSVDIDSEDDFVQLGRLLEN